MPWPEPIRIPSYCLHKSTGQAYVTLDGRVKYLGTYKLTGDGRPDCPEYHRLIANRLAGGTTPPVKVTGTDAVPLTVAELLAGYWAYCEVKHKGSELYAIRAALKPVNRLFADLDASRFGPRALTRVQQEMRRAGWCRTNINRQLWRVRAAWKWGVREELVDVSIFTALTTVEALSYDPDTTRESDPVTTTILAVGKDEFNFSLNQFLGEYRDHFIK